MAQVFRAEIAAARRAFYALCTHIDHQLRLIIGLLAEEGILDNTLIAFTADHDDMLGDHGLFAKSFFYEGSSQPHSTDHGARSRVQAPGTPPDG